VDRFGRLVADQASGGKKEGKAEYLGKQKRSEFAQEMEAVCQTLPVGVDPLFPRGGKRWWYFDATNHLPVLLVTQDHEQREVEYYRHEQLQYPARLGDDDFNPDRLWKKK
jgi:hypothetical protein